MTGDVTGSATFTNLGNATLTSKITAPQIHNNNTISVLNGSAAQGIKVNSLYAGTSYSNSAPSGMVNALNGFQVANSTVINSSGNWVGGGNISEFTNNSGYITASSSAVTNKLPLAGGTLTGKLTLNDAGYSLGNEYHKWKRAYTVTTSSPQEILYSDGNSLPTGGVYRFTAHISGTGTDQFATAVYWNQNGTWRINVTGQSGTSSNHPEFIIDGTTNKPTIHIDHSSNYGIHILGERIELDEGTGTVKVCLLLSSGY